MTGPREHPWPPGKLLALDVGQARIGVATCDPLGITVRPLTVLRRGRRQEDFQRIAQLVQEEGAEAIVCGLPLNMDGSEGPQARTVRRWAGRLARALQAILGRPVPIHFWDERLTSFAAQELLAEGETQAGEDAVAAALILQSYLDAQRRGESLDYGSVLVEGPPPQPEPGRQETGQATRQASGQKADQKADQETRP